VALDNTLQILGSRLKDSVTQDLEKNGLYSDHPDYFEITKASYLLNRLFGEDATLLIMERVFVEVDTLCTDQLKKRHVPLVVEA
jgi:hypothetical protein